MHGNSIIPTDAVHDAHYRDTSRHGELEFGPLRVAYSCDEDGGSIAIQSVKLTPTAKHKTMDDALFEAVDAVLKSINATWDELVSENRNEWEEREA